MLKNLENITFQTVVLMIIFALGILGAAFGLFYIFTLAPIQIVGLGLGTAFILAWLKLGRVILDRTK